MDNSENVFTLLAEEEFSKSQCISFKFIQNNEMGTVSGNWKNIKDYEISSENGKTFILVSIREQFVAGSGYRLELKLLNEDIWVYELKVPGK